MTKEDSKAIKSQKLYELSFLYSPLVAPEVVGERLTETAKTVIEGAKGLITEMAEPRLTSLAYPVGKSVEHKRTTFSEAYFGAVRFEAEPAQLVMIEERLKTNPDFVRWMIFAVKRGAEKLAEFKKATSPRRRAASKEVVDPAPAETPKEAMSAEAIDKEIDGLLAKTS